MLEKRRAKRHDLSLPVLIEHESGYFHISKTRNVSDCGANVLMDTSLSVGQPVRMTYDIDIARNLEFGVSGRVVRVDSNKGAEQKTWPFLMALEFSEIQPEVIAYLKTLELSNDVFA